VKALVGDVEELNKMWDMLDTCYDQPKKYKAEPLNQLSSCERTDSLKKPQFENITPSSDQCDGARGVNLLGKLINEQTLTGTMSSVHKGGWKQWTKHRAGGQEAGHRGR
jgi:hypothetical protein